MLTDPHQKAYEEFYASTHNNEFLDSKSELLVGLAAAIAMNCKPCTQYYLNLCKKQDIPEGAVQEVLAKVMAVAAGQKRLQFKEVMDEQKQPK